MKNIFFCCMFVLLLSGCEAVNVTAGVDTIVDFSGLVSFSWLP